MSKRFGRQQKKKLCAELAKVSSFEHIWRDMVCTMQGEAADLRKLANHAREIIAAVLRATVEEIAKFLAEQLKAAINTSNLTKPELQDFGLFRPTAKENNLKVTL